MAKGSKPSKAALSKAGTTLASDSSSKSQKSDAGKTRARAMTSSARRAAHRQIRKPRPERASQSAAKAPRRNRAANPPEPPRTAIKAQPHPALPGHHPTTYGSRLSRDPPTVIV